MTEQDFFATKGYERSRDLTGLCVGKIYTSALCCILALWLKHWPCHLSLYPTKTLSIG